MCLSGSISRLYISAKGPQAEIPGKKARLIFYGSGASGNSWSDDLACSPLAKAHDERISVVN